MPYLEGCYLATIFQGGVVHGGGVQVFVRKRYRECVILSTMKHKPLSQ